jgi:hypothetical protein
MKDSTPYPEAFELKELGFDEPCFGYWYTEQEEFKKIDIQLSSIGFLEGEPDYILAPTYSQAFRYFREKYDIHYSIDRECSQHDHKWGYNWSLYNYTGIFDEYLTSHPDAPAGEWVYETYEEAELDCLRKMIEIVKVHALSSGMVENDGKKISEASDQLVKKLIDNQKDIPNDFNQIISDNFFDLT